MFPIGTFGAAAQIGTIQSFYNYYNNAIWKPNNVCILPGKGCKPSPCGPEMFAKGPLCCPNDQTWNKFTRQCRPRHVPPVESGPQREDRRIDWKRDKSKKYSPHRPTPNGGANTEISEAGMGFTDILLAGGLIFGGVWAFKKFTRKKQFAALKPKKAVGGK